MINYRREIDGLRAIAILPVILSHAGFNLFSGGFVGVDVFFVISGYLITQIIIREKQSGIFSIRRFYERRARRILPALYFVLFICTFYSAIFLSPFDARDYYQSLAATISFCSNVLFYIESSDYFGLAADYKPLLHTWSLGVEEQYYVLYPLFLIGSWRLGIRKIVVMLIVVAILSLIASQWAVINNPSASFYLLPTRAWELLVGGFVGFYLIKNASSTVITKYNQLGSAVGLLMIGASVFLFNKSTPFPGIFALVPVIGTAFVIIFANQDTLVGWLLGRKLLVGIGLISYSAYLWHQPVLAFARYYLLSDLSIVGALAAITLTFALAMQTWQFIEQPFRRNGVVSNNIFFKTIALVSLGLLCFSIYGHLSFGLQKAKLQLLSENKRNFYVDQFTENLSKEKTVQSLDLNKYVPDIKEGTHRKVLIIGDSMASDLYLALKLNDSLYKNHLVRIYLLDDLNMDNFLNYVIMQKHTVPPKSVDTYERLKLLIANNDDIVLAANWSKETAAVSLELGNYLSSLNKIVYIVDAFNIFHISSSSYYFAKNEMPINDLDHFMFKRLSTNYLSIHNYMKTAINTDKKIHYVDKLSLFCDLSKETCTLFNEAALPLIIDEMHVSVEGAKYYGKALAKAGFLNHDTN
jgi:peptidoglycan/LPS O-acetylase OafA/YrhL